jgi:CheY-like chemotaxis protein
MLIVEDNNFIQVALQQQLNHLGVDYVPCMNGQEAVDKMEEFLKKGKSFDIVLMDLIMPVMDGYKATVAIRELEKKYGIEEQDKHFICGYSAEVNFNTEKICFEKGMDDIVAKPMSVETLERLLQEHDQRRKRSQINLV